MGDEMRLGHGTCEKCGFPHPYGYICDKAVMTTPHVSDEMVEALAERACAAFMQGDDWRGRCSYPDEAFDRVLEALAAALSAMPGQGWRDHITRLFRDHISEVPAKDSPSRWAILSDMQELLAKHGYCEPPGVHDVKGFGLTTEQRGNG